MIFQILSVEKSVFLSHLSVFSAEKQEKLFYTLHRVFFDDLCCD